MKIVVIDDDPTGSQTVHSCPLLLRWDEAALRRGLRHPSPLVFVLANTRALTPEAAASRNREIVEALVLAMAAEGLQEHELLLVSRGDSTLRGHGVLEPQVLVQAFTPGVSPRLFNACSLTPSLTSLSHSDSPLVSPFLLSLAQSGFKLPLNKGGRS